MAVLIFEIDGKEQEFCYVLFRFMLMEISKQAVEFMSLEASSGERFDIGKVSR